MSKVLLTVMPAAWATDTVPAKPNTRNNAHTTAAICSLALNRRIMRLYSYNQLGAR